MGAKHEILVKVDDRLEKLIPKFLNTQKAQFELMKEAFAAKKFGELKLLGHRMKGSCGGYGFLLLGELGGKVESAAADENVKILSSCIEGIEDCLKNLKIEFHKA